jgi:hypothetical protein
VQRPHRGFRAPGIEPVSARQLPHFLALQQSADGVARRILVA